jgi:transposase
MLTPTVRRTLAPRGQTPIHRCCDRRDRISAISAITLSPKRKRLNLYFHLLADNRNVHADDVVDFLRHLRRHLPGAFTLVWDRSHTHDRARKVQAFLARRPEVRTEKFPGYAPELNPDEQVWTHTKYARMANFAPHDTKHLRRRLGYELQRIKKRPDLLASFIRHAKLPSPLRGPSH